MAFSLKKFISFFLEPFTLGFFLFLLAFCFLLFNSYKKAKVTLFIAIVYLFFISSSIVSNLLISPLENKYKNQENIDISKIEYILLLGGDFQGRAYEIIKLSKKLNTAKVITSGYAGNAKITNALYSKQELVSLGVDENRIIMLEKTRDTIEEAIEIKNLLNNKPFILVTSASHMPRAIKIFQNEGLHPIAIPTLFMSGNNEQIDFLSIGELKKVSMAIHEYLGLTWLKIKTFLNK